MRYASLLVLLFLLFSIIYLRPPITHAEPVAVDGEGYEWSYDSCHALDNYGDLLDSTSDYYDSRDLIAWYYMVGSDYVYMRLDLLDLAYGAEVASTSTVSDALNIYIMIGWENAPGYQEWVPDYVQYNGKGIHLADYHWVLAIAIYDTNNYRVYDYNWNIVVEDSGLSIAYHSQWDLIELAIPVNVLENYGWTPTTRVWAKIATTLVTDSTSVLADIMPNDIVDAGSYYDWSGAVFSDSHVGTAKVIIVHHGNQHLTDNRALNDPSSRNSYWYVLWIHDDVSNKTGRKIPVAIHISGTLLASYVWYDPWFVNYIKELIGRDVVDVIGGVWAEYITAYFYDNFNDPSADLARYYYYKVLGYSPRVAWIPERTWDDERTGIAATISKYYEAVILDGNTHHDDWSSDNDYNKPHLYDTTKTDGRTLYVFFIDWDTQQLLLSNTDNGLDKTLRMKYLDKALDPDQEQVMIYADDWEKAAGIAGWDSSNIDRYENSIRWIAMHPWIQVVTPDQVLDWLDNGYWDPATGFYCGYDTYYYLKTWVQDYPYDYRRAYDGWYWGTSSEEAFAALGASSVEIGGVTTPGRTMPDTIMPLGDVFGYTSYNGSPDNTIIYKLLRPDGLLDNTPRNEFWWLALATADAMLYETAWHTEDDSNGDGLQDTAYWGRWVWNHLRLVNVLLKAAEWLDYARNGLIGGVDYSIGDYDWDGKDEVIIYNEYLFVFVDQKGGAVPYVFVYDPYYDLAYVGVGAPMVFWTYENDYWMNAGHYGLYVDDYYDVTRSNYYDKDYTIDAWYDATYDRVIVELTPPDLNHDGKPDFYKYIVLYSGSVSLYAYYQLVVRSARIGGTLYVSMGLSVDPWTNLFYGDVLEQINTPEDTNTFGYLNTVSNALVYVDPIQYVSYTGSQDLVKETLQYRFKLAVEYSGTDYAIVKTVFTTY